MVPLCRPNFPYIDEAGALHRGARTPTCASGQKLNLGSLCASDLMAKKYWITRIQDLGILFSSDVTKHSIVPH